MKYDHLCLFSSFVESLQGEKIITHEGGINGFPSRVWFMPSFKTLTVDLSNSACNPTVKTAETLTAVAIVKPLPEQNRIQLPESLLQNYAGTYLMDGKEWTVSIKENKLYFQFPNVNGHPIYPVSENECYAQEWDSKFRFR